MILTFFSSFLWINHKKKKFCGLISIILYFHPFKLQPFSCSPADQSHSKTFSHFFFKYSLFSEVIGGLPVYVSQQHSLSILFQLFFPGNLSFEMIPQRVGSFFMVVLSVCRTGRGLLSILCCLYKAVDVACFQMQHADDCRFLVG